MSRRDRARRPARQLGRLTPKRRILVVCEGEVTEPSYIDGFKKQCRNHLVEVRVLDSHGVPMTLVREAKQQRAYACREAKAGQDENLMLDEVWCVFDVDEHPNFANACQMARDNDICLAVSSPCFELWLLLHFQDSPGAQHRDQVRRLLKKHMPGYSKKIDFEDVAKHIGAAMARAERLQFQADQDEDSHRNPTSSVYKLLKSIQAV